MDAILLDTVRASWAEPHVLSWSDSINCIPDMLAAPIQSHLTILYDDAKLGA